LTVDRRRCKLGLFMAGKRGKSRTVTREQYEALVEAFWRHGERWQVISDETGLDYYMVRRAWSHGFRAAGEWARPISAVIADRQVAVRASLGETSGATVPLRTPQGEAEKAKAEIIKAREAETLAVRGARENAVLALSTSNRILRQMQAVANEIAERFRGSTKDIDPAVFVMQFGRLVSVMRQSIDAAEAAMRMERMLVGEPEKIIGLQVSLDTADMSPEEVMRELEAAARAHERAKGYLKVIDGADAGGSDSNGSANGAA
jgi:hypothetical protein